MNTKWMGMEIDVRLAGIGRPDPCRGIFDRAAAEEMVRQFEEAAAGTLLGQFADRGRGLSPSLEISLRLHSSVSHVVKSVWIEDHSLMATVRMLSTPLGNSLRQLIEAGIEMDFFPSVLGSQRPDGTVEVGRLLGVDVAQRDVQGRRQERIALALDGQGTNNSTKT